MKQSTSTCRRDAAGRIARLLCLAILFSATTAMAADEQPAPPVQPRHAESTPAEPKCVHGCQRWGKFCNVDPRGVYKCRRRCEKFGEICE